MTRQRWTDIGLAAVAIITFMASCGVLTLQAQEVDFDKQVAPILVSHCLECHRRTRAGNARRRQRGGNRSGESIKEFTVGTSQFG